MNSRLPPPPPSSEAFCDLHSDTQNWGNVLLSSRVEILQGRGLRSAIFADTPVFMNSSCMSSASCRLTVAYMRKEPRCVQPSPAIAESMNRLIVAELAALIQLGTRLFSAPSLQQPTASNSCLEVTIMWSASS